MLIILTRQWHKDGKNDEEGWKYCKLLRKSENWMDDEDERDLLLLIFCKDLGLVLFVNFRVLNLKTYFLKIVT